MIRLVIYNSSGEGYDVTELAMEITGSGNYQSCARELSFDILTNSLDKDFPAAPCDIGNRVLLYVDEIVFFDGFVFSRSKSTDTNRITLNCFDRGYYLKRNKGRYSFSGITPEAIASRICGDFGIAIGDLAFTGVALSRNFVNVEIYKIIMTAYTLAAEQTKKKYQALFIGDRLNVIEKTVDENTLLFEAGSGLMSAVCTESIEQMINRVEIYNSDATLLQTITDSENLKYGALQETLQQSESGDSLVGKAQKMIDEHGYLQKMTIENMGNARCVTGRTVVVQEPFTGICGLFWINSDVHTWKNGLYFNKLTISFDCLMDTQEAGSLPKAVSTTAGESSVISQRGYVNKPQKGDGVGGGGGGRRFSRVY